MGELIRLPVRNRTGPVAGGNGPPVDVPGEGKGAGTPATVTRLWDWVDRARKAKQARRGANLRREHFERLVTKALDRAREQRPGDHWVPPPPRGTDGYED